MPDLPPSQRGGMKQHQEGEEKGEDSMKGPLWGFSPAQKRQTEMKALEKNACLSAPEAPAQGSLPAFPLCHLLFLPLLLQAGATVKEHGWAAGQGDMGSNPIPVPYLVTGLALARTFGPHTPHFSVKGQIALPFRRL